MTIFISSYCIKNRNTKEACRMLYNNNIKNIELSSGTYQRGIKRFLFENKNKYKFQIHNYFPVPKKPFVFNLASKNKIIQKKSLLLAFEAINLANKIKSPFYSFHAGFLYDPDVNEIGKKINNIEPIKREIAKKIFIKNIKILSKHAKKKSVRLLIENNVENYDVFKKIKKSTVLMAHPKEIISIMKAMPENVFLLMDVAHLKVSSKTLKFSKEKAMIDLKKWILGYHFSDNNGLIDNNKNFTNKSWFWPFIKKKLNYYSLETYNNSIFKLKKNIEICRNKLLR